MYEYGDRQFTDLIQAQCFYFALCIWCKHFTYNIIICTITYQQIRPNVLFSYDVGHQWKIEGRIRHSLIITWAIVLGRRYHIFASILKMTKSRDLLCDSLKGQAFKLYTSIQANIWPFNRCFKILDPPLINTRSSAYINILSRVQRELYTTIFTIWYGFDYVIQCFPQGQKKKVRRFILYIWNNVYLSLHTKFQRLCLCFGVQANDDGLI